MGTNYYWKTVERHEIALPTGEVVEAGCRSDHMDSVIHIGKRSAAGLYCWTCRQTLCKDGEKGIHHSCRHPQIGCKCRWHDACPNCGAKHEKEDGFPRSTSMELGFAKARTELPQGEHSCSSFSWAQDPENVRRILEVRPDEALVESEYGDPLTGREFLEMLAANCPVEYTHSVGEQFS